MTLFELQCDKRQTWSIEGRSLNSFEGKRLCVCVRADSGMWQTRSLFMWLCIWRGAVPLESPARILRSCWKGMIGFRTGWPLCDRWLGPGLAPLKSPTRTYVDSHMPTHNIDLSVDKCGLLMIADYCDKMEQEKVCTSKWNAAETQLWHSDNCTDKQCEFRKWHENNIYCSQCQCCGLAGVLEPWVEHSEALLCVCLSKQEGIWCLLLLVANTALTVTATIITAISSAATNNTTASAIATCTGSSAKRKHPGRL